ncbi:transposase [Flammeovirgaceae bacterium 311]|nr:transposase [Flammeovirgaceae bacterium 311]
MQGILKKGRHSSRKIKRARVLLLLSERATAEESVDKADVGLSTVYQIWNRYLDEGKDAGKAIDERPRSGQPPKLTDEVKAHITAIACSKPPESIDHRTLQMIADKVVELEYVEKISTEAIRKYLKKTGPPGGLSSPGRKSSCGRRCGSSVR